MFRRCIIFTLVGLFAVGSGLTYTSATADVPAGATFNAQARRGEVFYRTFNCTACHQLYGLGGYMGPDLTNVIVADGKGRAYATAIIQAGTQRMPRLGVSMEQADAIASYLEAVAATGTYPVRSVDLTLAGTYRQMHERPH